jgi:hypothetical protein
LAFVSSIFKYFLKSPKKRKIRVCLNRIESMSLLWSLMLLPIWYSFLALERYVVLCCYFFSVIILLVEG